MWGDEATDTRAWGDEAPAIRPKPSLCPSLCIMQECNANLQNLFLLIHFRSEKVAASKR